MSVYECIITNAWYINSPFLQIKLLKIHCSLHKAELSEHDHGKQFETWQKTRFVVHFGPWFLCEINSEINS